MLTEVQVKNTNREDLPALVLPIHGESKYPVVFIDGLNPVKAEISSSPYANLPGDHFQSSRVGPRNIVLTLELSPSYSTGEDVERVRQDLRRWLNVESRVEMTFVTTDVQRVINGVVEAFEAPMFVETPQVQISILCHDPYFAAMSPRNFNAWVMPGDPFLIENNGDVSVGFTAWIYASGMVGNEFLISNQSNAMGGGFQIVYDFQSGTEVSINTLPRQKHVVVNGNHSLLPYITKGSVWPIVTPGNNVFNIGFREAASSTSVNLSFVERYSGL